MIKFSFIETVEDINTLVTLCNISAEIDLRDLGLSASLKLLNLKQLLSLDNLKSAFSAYYLTIKSLRESLNRITLVENDLDFERPDLCSRYRVTILDELLSRCSDLIDILDVHLTKYDYSGISLIFLLKTKGDYYRYVIESKAYLKEEDYIRYLEEAGNSYLKAFEISNSDDIYLKDSTTIALVVNYCIFLRTTSNQQELAVDKAHDYYDKVSKLDYDKSDTSFTNNLERLRENIERWDYEDSGIDANHKNMSISKIITPDNN